MQMAKPAATAIPTFDRFFGGAAGPASCFGAGSAAAAGCACAVSGAFDGAGPGPAPASGAEAGGLSSKVNSSYDRKSRVAGKGGSVRVDLSWRRHLKQQTK